MASPFIGCSFQNCEPSTRPSRAGSPRVCRICPFSTPISQSGSARDCKGICLQSKLAYWKQQLAGAPAALELPTDRPRPPVPTYRGAMRPFALSKHLSDALKALSRQEGVTLFMALLAAFNTLLYRYAGRDDLLIGTSTAGRKRSEIQGLMGYFLNTLVLRTNLSGNPTFRELLVRVREVTNSAFAHEDLPFE